MTDRRTATAAGHEEPGPLGLSVARAGERQKLDRALQTVRERTSRIEQSSLRDELTGLFNRSFYLESLEKAISRAQRSVAPLTVAVLDIDHFKRVNDQRGHYGGDRVLRKMGEILRAHTRETDGLGRWGGEEFLVLLPHTGAGEVAVVGQPPGRAGRVGRAPPHQIPRGGLKSRRPQRAPAKTDPGGEPASGPRKIHRRNVGPVHPDVPCPQTVRTAAAHDDSRQRSSRGACRSVNHWLGRSCGTAALAALERRRRHNQTPTVIFAHGTHSGRATP